MSIRCLIIDDEPLALNVLAGYIQQTPDLQLVDLTTRPRHGLTRVLNGEADLVFLDIEMKELHGMEFLKQASGHAHFILTTAYPDYALQGYEFDVKDYLLKPFSYERFVKAIQKIPPPVAAPASPGYFFVKSEYKLIRVDHADIIYLEALRDYVAIHTIKGQKLLTLQSLSSFEKELPPALFARVHKSYIVALSRVTVIEKNRLLLHDLSIPVGETYRGKLGGIFRK
ncbi:MAG: response regulator transcription factor [Chitinophagaceae bacterium]|nr:response regulator transcription factor [Chitinophagaceae bacterium]